MQILMIGAVTGAFARGPAASAQQDGDDDAAPSQLPAEPEQEPLLEPDAAAGGRRAGSPDPRVEAVKPMASEELVPIRAIWATYAATS